MHHDTIGALVVEIAKQGIPLTVACERDGWSVVDATGETFVASVSAREVRTFLAGFLSRGMA